MELRRTAVPDAAALGAAILAGVGSGAFEALYRSAAVDPAVINIGGGGSLSDAWCQIRADVLGKPLRRCVAPESAALGAAILAGQASGIGGTLTEAVRQLVRYDRVFEPNGAVAGYHADRFGHYQALYADLRVFNTRF
jgi:xylulokinase